MFRDVMLVTGYWALGTGYLNNVRALRCVMLKELFENS